MDLRIKNSPKQNKDMIDYITRVAIEPHKVALIEKHRDFFLAETTHSSRPRKIEMTPESEEAFEEQNWEYWQEMYANAIPYKGSI